MIRRAAFALLPVCPCMLAVASTLLPYRQIETVDPARQTTFHLDAGSITQPLDAFATTALRPGAMASTTLTGGSDDPFAAGSSRAAYVMVVPTGNDAYYYYVPVAVIGELLDTTAPGVSVVLGVDSNDDGAPEADEVLCESQRTAAGGGRCVIGPQMGPTHRYWIMAVAPDVPGGAFTADVSGGIAEATGPLLIGEDTYSGGQTTVSGPGSVAAGAAFDVTMTRSAAAAPLQRYYGALLLGSGHLLGGTVAIVPFALEQADAYPLLIDPNAGPVELTAFGTQTRIFMLNPGHSLRRLFFDLPAGSANYDSIELTARVVGAVPAQVTLDLAAVRGDFPSSSRSAVVDAAPTDSAPAVRWSATAGDRYATAVLAHPRAGRWYIVATNEGDEPVSFVAGIADASDATATAGGFGRGSNPLIVPGKYFNPRRSGAGISISQAAGQQLLFWYSYLQDGTPVWYVAQAAAPAPDSGWWTSPLYRATWDGSSATPTQVGYVELVPTATDRLQFSWHLGDDSGSETFELLASGRSCTNALGAPQNLSGNWFAPSQSGYDVDVLALPDQQFDVFYLYDATGAPRWSVGAAAFGLDSTLTMLQSDGFCPLCDYRDVTTQVLGPLTIDFADASSGRFSTKFSFQAPLGGAWNIDRPMLRLTGNSTCE